jgi:hypothetical protein
MPLNRRLATRKSGSACVWAHLTFVEPASWLGWAGKTIIQKCSPDKRRFREIPLYKSKKRPAKMPGKRRIKSIAPIRIEGRQCG